MDERRFNACGEVDRIDDTLQKWLCATRFVDCKNWFKRLLTTADSNIEILSRTKKIVLNYSHSHVDVANINISYHKFNRKITNPSYSTFDICFASGVVSTLNIITGFLNHFICFSVRVSDRKCPPIGCFVGYVWTKIFTHVRKFLLPAKNISAPIRLGRKRENLDASQISRPRDFCDGRRTLPTFETGSIFFTVGVLRDRWSMGIRFSSVPIP